MINRKIENDSYEIKVNDNVNVNDDNVNFLKRKFEKPNKKNHSSNKLKTKETNHRKKNRRQSQETFIRRSG